MLFCTSGFALGCKIAYIPPRRCITYIYIYLLAKSHLKSPEEETLMMFESVGLNGDLANRDIAGIGAYSLHTYAYHTAFCCRRIE